MKTRIFLVFFAALYGLSGCSVGKTSVVFVDHLKENEIFRINDTVCGLPEAMVYLCNYQNIYGSAYGINLWEHETEEHSLERYVKDITISELARIVCMDELAKQQEIALTDEEKGMAEQAAQTYYESLTQEEIDYMGASESVLMNMYQDYALAQKLYTSLTEGVNDEVSDDEARVMEAQRIYVTTKERADAVRDALKDGRDFLSVAADYNEASRIEITFGRGDLPQEVEQAAFELEDNEITGCIEANNGFYFIKCTSKFNQELTDERKLTIVKQREKEAFDDTYEAFTGTLESTFNTAVWDAVKIRQDSDIETDSFFEVYEEYFVR